MINKTRKEEKLEYITKVSTSRYCKDTLKAVATVDHKKTEISAYLYAFDEDCIKYPLKSEY